MPQSWRFPPTKKQLWKTCTFQAAGHESGRIAKRDGNLACLQNQTCQTGSIDLSLQHLCSSNETDSPSQLPVSPARCPHKLTICWLVTTQTFKELGLWVSRFFVALTHCSPSMMTFSTCSFASVRALHWNHQKPTPKFKVKPAGHLQKHGKINVKNVNGHRPETPFKKSTKYPSQLSCWIHIPISWHLWMKQFWCYAVSDLAK